MNKHTQGNWAVGAIHGGLIDIESYIGGVKLRVGQIIRTKDGIGEANARLIATAPDLLAALELIVQVYDQGHGIECVIGAGRTAIAKATGEKP